MTLSFIPFIFHLFIWNLSQIYIRFWEFSHLNQQIVVLLDVKFFKSTKFQFNWLTNWLGFSIVFASISLNSKYSSQSLRLNLLFQ
jgi:hypothetical protein